jgi:hypothetical protein
MLCRETLRYEKESRAIRVEFVARTMAHRSRNTAAGRAINCTASPRQSQAAYELSPSCEMVYNPAVRRAVWITRQTTPGESRDLFTIAGTI